jgi:Domain of unknown function (DUF222)
MAQSGYNANVVAVGRTLMSLVGTERSLERDETALRALSCLRLSPMDNGMLRVSGQLDPEAGAVLRAALDPLTAPHPTTPNPAGKRFTATNPDRTGNDNSGNRNNRTSHRNTYEPGTGRDLRPPERRRAEALVELCRRAAAAGGAAPATSKAQIVVTIEHDTLKNALRGARHTLDGTVLSPQSVRKLACDASIIPMVLGSKSQPLDVGRTKRLVTPALLAALWARDKTCTFPSCETTPMERRPPRQTLDRRRTHRPATTSPCCAVSILPLAPLGGPPPGSTNATSPPQSPPTTSPGKPDASVLTDVLRSLTGQLVKCTRPMSASCSLRSTGEYVTLPDQSPMTALRTASRLRSTSFAVVDQLLTEIRSTLWSRQVEPVIQAVPSASSRRTTSSVRSSVPNAAHTWVNSTSFRTATPSMSFRPVAKAQAWWQRRSTSSATPVRPSERSTAHTGNARPRREVSGTLSNGSPSSSWIR